MTVSKPHPMDFLLKQSLSRKLLLILVIGATATTVSTAVFGYYHANRLRTDGAANAMQHRAKNLASRINISLDASVGLLKQLTNDPRILQAVERENQKFKNLSPGEVKQRIQNEIAIWKASNNRLEKLDALRSVEAGLVLLNFVRANPNLQSVIAVNGKGKAVAASGKLNSPYPGKNKPWVQSKITGLGKAAISEPFFEGKDAAPSVLICVPISPDATGGFEGELYANLSLKRIVSSRTEDEREIVGFLLASADKRLLYVLDPPDIASPQPVAFRIEGETLSPEGGGWFSMELDRLKISALAGFAPVGNSKLPASAEYVGRQWFAVQAEPQSLVMGPVNALFMRTLVFALGLLALISIAALGVSRQILKPIHMLQEGVQEIGQGNLEHRIDVRSGDEIEALAFEFNRMAERMQRTQEQLQRRGKELEQRVNQLRRLQAQLMQSERMAATGELAAQIAHEINNPLGIIKNYVGIARMLMPEEDPNRENLKIVDQEINRTAGIVRRLLKFAKPGSEDIQNVQINQVLEELLALLRGQLFRSKIEVSIDLAENLPEVSISTDQMRQVFLNLVKNAEDAMPDGGKLSVRTLYRKGRVEVEITDTGCGIPPEDVKNIFEPFFTTKGVKGTGLGLSVSYGIVKNYSGEINVESEPGVGTTFRIQLPVVSDKVFQVIQSP